jgi:hypothetical protein
VDVGLRVAGAAHAVLEADPEQPADGLVPLGTVVAAAHAKAVGLQVGQRRLERFGPCGVDLRPPGGPAAGGEQ